MNVFATVIAVVLQHLLQGYIKGPLRSEETLGKSL